MSTKLILDNYLGKNTRMSEKDAGNGFKEVCDLDTGDCYTIRMKDGLIERVDNTMNWDINNLEMFHQSGNMELNTIQRFPAELQEVIKLKSKLKKKINGTKQNQ